MQRAATEHDSLTGSRAREDKAAGGMRSAASHGTWPTCPLQNSFRTRMLLPLWSTSTTMPL